jgi:hypothetical protein
VIAASIEKQTSTLAFGKRFISIDIIAAVQGPSNTGGRILAEGRKARIDVPARRFGPMLRSIAVVAGSYLLSVILVFCTDPLLARIFPGDFVKGQIPSNAPLLASTTLFVVVSILCSWLCARLASDRASKHVLWFFIVGEVMGIGAIIPNWSKGWPHWYWLSWLLTWPISCWIGLQLARRRTTKLVA